MSAAALDPVIHAPNRLQICCMLAGVDTIDFSTLREALDVSESVLSKHFKTLEEAGYLKVAKTPSDGRVRTWASLTVAGRKALKGHLAALKAMMAGVPEI
ncbi:MarR family transcriptional regulator [Caulobacter zeae]|uniref:MarR family transcriptional regulator n=1 Tax=Caulobacter zeae TaxID=2055137 RepID=A0A2N5DPN5_9CAUL|nr:MULTISPECIES: transcriptional regulator [Caulobacter]PLR28020.1 MarR family transcriptional regulator [Caulobacter zeae]PVM93188.1 MarR family transcriptional regulator [Caulobacter radicis]